MKRAAIVAVLLAACARSHGSSRQPSPPPYWTRVCEGTPDAEYARWVDAASEWHRVMNATQQVFWIARTNASGCGVYICAGTENAVRFGECETRVSYVPGDGQEARLLGLVAGVRMEGERVTAEDAEDLRAMWY